MLSRKLLFVLLCLLLWQQKIWAQEDIFPVNGVQDQRPGIYLFTHATIYQDYQTPLEDASLLIRDGKVEAIGTNISAPQGATVIDLKGKFIYPSMIDLYSDYGLSPVPKKTAFSYNAREQLERETKGPYSTNDAIKSQYNAVEDFEVKDDDAKLYRQVGFGTVLSHKKDGLARGSSSLVTLSDEEPNTVVLIPKAAAHYSFDKGSSQQYYPISKMGFMALLRQTYLDAAWYQSTTNENYVDNSLMAWNALQELPQVFEAPGWIQILRADKLGDEFGVQYIIRGNGDEYQRLDEIKATNASLIVPVNFPDAYEVDDPYDAQDVRLKDMMHWELAPANLGRLATQGIPFAITADGLKDKKDFWPNVRKAIRYGLSEEAALKALTFTPAQLMGAEDQVGSLKEGALANFLITSGNIFQEDAVIYENWVQGKPFVLADKDASDLSGTYSLRVGEASYGMEVRGKPGKQQFKLIHEDTTQIKAEVKGNLITLNFTSPDDSTATIRLSGWLEGRNLQGQGQLPDGTWVSWEATYQNALPARDSATQEKETVDLDQLSQIIYPFMPFGNPQLPEARTYLIRNATVWTNEAEGIVENTDVLVRDSKIAQIGRNLSASNVAVIDGTGKHLTSGIIDEHSHIALTSINDVAANSSMVRMKDVVDAEDIDIYRQLSGGVTASQLLHGSANPIGGQSAIVKLRWGAAPEDMLIEGAGEFIKFALGENVKRSGNENSIRYPQTRMGVEQVYVDAFTRARAYADAWEAYNNLSAREKANAVPPRRDLSLEALVEIMQKERFVTCHSYVQSEINMMMHVAEQFGFNINTFTHILEGYKVADKMAAHGAGGSTFADWWAYKFEVRYAIPYNPALMNMAGVTTAINSDDAEMARRLNQEAAKSVKYGGMPEEEAWKMVTLNPAKLLHLDDRMGSVKVGKDADLVLWSDHPLSIYAKVEKNMIDGRIYYDLEQDVEKREMIARERARLIQKMQQVGKNGEATQTASGTSKQRFHCDDLEFGQIIHTH